MEYTEDSSKLSKVKEMVENIMKIEIKSFDENLTELGISSLLFIKVVVCIEDEYDIEFENDDLIKYNELNTIRKIVNYIESKNTGIQSN